MTRPKKFRVAPQRDYRPGPPKVAAAPATIDQLVVLFGRGLDEGPQAQRMHGGGVSR